MVNNFEYIKTGFATSFSFHSFLSFKGGMRKGERITSLSHICIPKIIKFFRTYDLNHGGISSQIYKLDSF